ncbi:hypothetical protein BM1_08292 [Bipolaris maydis]|nr:hypothetical protein BM1_08292 [Bipolaris maydis]
MTLGDDDAPTRRRQLHVATKNPAIAPFTALLPQMCTVVTLQFHPIPSYPPFHKSPRLSPPGQSNMTLACTLQMLCISTANGAPGFIRLAPPLRHGRGSHTLIHLTSRFYQLSDWLPDAPVV